MRSKNGTPRKRRSKNVPYVIHNMKSTMPRTTFKTIRKLQLSTDLLIPKLPFSRLVREIMQRVESSGEPHRIQMAALAALQEAAERYLIDILTDSNMCCAHAKRTTVAPKDMQLVLALRSNIRPSYM